MSSDFEGIIDLVKGRVYHQHDFDFKNPLHQLLDGEFCKGNIAGWKITETRLFINALGDVNPKVLWNIARQLEDFGYDSKIDMNMVFNKKTGDFYQQIEMRRK